MHETTYDVATQPVFGLNVAAIGMSEAVSLAEVAVADRARLLVGVVNAAKVVKLHHDVFLRDSLLECDLLLADGQSVVWGAKIVGHPLPERVAGIDLFTELLAVADRDHLRVYLLGARQDVMDRLVEEIGRRWPGAVVAGSRNGYFTDDESAEVAAGIRAARADMLFLGMTTPKKEIFLGSYADSLGVPVLHGVGGSFDVIAGVTKRAPVIWQRTGMEWAYRLLQEPRRLWRRYLVTNLLFAWMLVQERIRPRPLYARTPVVPAAVAPAVVAPAAAVAAVAVPQQRTGGALRVFPSQRSGSEAPAAPVSPARTPELVSLNEEVSHE
jgi:N-acetylglucosaminyldiphosphoundecaprenol N-acetyl-beta-D-mannosaminyltransferase